jgi:hypothetical protein
VSRNPTAGASIGEPRALAYTSCTAYVSYVRVYHLLTPSTLTIDCVMSCRLLEYICLAATVPHLVIYNLYCLSLLFILLRFLLRIPAVAPPRARLASLGTHSI